MAEPMNLAQYLERVRNEEITTISFEAALRLTPVTIDDFLLRSVGAVLLELEDRKEPLPIQTLHLTVDNVLVKSAAAVAVGTGAASDYPILQYLRSTTSLKHLRLTFVWLIALPPDGHRISDAVAANESIAELTMEYVREPIHVFFMNETFEKLASRYPPREPLETIHLHFILHEEDWIAKFPGFFLYFESLANRNEKLEQLVLSIVRVKVQLLNSLLETYARQMQRIDLIGCIFDAASCQRFGSLLQESNNANGASVDVFIRPKIGELSWTTPSSLGAFWLPSAGHVKLREFVANTSVSVTRHLPILAFHLPKSLYLNSLELSLNQDDPSEGDECFNVPGDFFHNDANLRRKQLLDAIRRNGSLRNVGFTMKVDASAYFSPHDERKVEVWVTRNKELPKLLSDPRLNNGVDLDDGTRDGETHLELFPSLFTAASVAESMSYTNVLIGLIAAAKGGNFQFGRTTTTSVDHVDDIQNTAHATGETEHESSLLHGIESGAMSLSPINQPDRELDEPVRLELPWDNSARTANTTHDSIHSTANNEAGEESELLGDTNKNKKRGRCDELGVFGRLPNFPTD